MVAHPIREWCERNAREGSRVDLEARRPNHLRHADRGTKAGTLVLRLNRAEEDGLHSTPRLFSRLARVAPVAVGAPMRFFSAACAAAEVRSRTRSAGGRVGLARGAQVPSACSIQKSS